MSEKILFILHYPPPVHGSSIVGGFIKDSKVITRTFNCRFINLGTSTSIEDIGQNSLRKLFRYVSLIWHVKKNLVFWRPQSCYFTPTAKGIGFYKDALVISLVKLFGVKTIYHYHNKGVSTRQDHFFDNLLYMFVFKNSNLILLSKHLYKDFQKYMPEDMVFYCPNGIPELKNIIQKMRISQQTEKISTLGVRKDKRQEMVTQILFLSHLIISKGVLVLIDACKLLMEKGLEFHCTIAGGNAEMTSNDVESYIKEKDLAEYVSVAGPKHDEEKYQLMESSDIFVHPTYNDCLPLVLLEAMQFSLPIVSTYEGAILDVVEDSLTGFLVPQKDVIALANRIEKLIKDPELRISMGRAGRLKYEREFSLEKFECRMKQILEEVALKRPQQKI